MRMISWVWIKMSMHKLLFKVAAVMVLFLVLSACGRQNDKKSAAGASDTAISKISSTESAVHNISSESSSATTQAKTDVTSSKTSTEIVVDADKILAAESSAVSSAKAESKVASSIVSSGTKSDVSLQSDGWGPIAKLP